jgi:hypothetical protein
MILGAPTADPAVAARRDELEKQRDAIAAELAHVELRLAADIVRHVFGTAAVWLKVDKDEHEQYGTAITLLVVLDADTQPLWFNSDGGRHDSNEYPGAHTIADDHGRPTREMDTETQAALVGHLTAAYDAAGGPSGALFATSDDFYGYELNVLCLSIPAAFDPFNPDAEPVEPQF